MDSVEQKNKAIVLAFAMLRTKTSSQFYKAQYELIQFMCECLHITGFDEDECTTYDGNALVQEFRIPLFFKKSLSKEVHIKKWTYTIVHIFGTMFLNKLENKV
jgi:hypothetical protein